MTTFHDVKLFSDASFDASTGAAGWGMWAQRHLRPAITGGGTLPVCVGSAAAEAQALAEALACLKRSNYLDGADSTLLIFCDNLSVLGLLASARPDFIQGRGEYGDRIRPADSAKLLKLRAGIEPALVELDALGFDRVTIQHVKAHRSNMLSWMNMLCDTRARAGMREMRSRIKSTETGRQRAEGVPGVPE